MQCAVCDEAITNPVGHNRLEEQVLSWLAETKPEIVEHFKLEELFSFMPELEPCIITKAPMKVCHYCVAQEGLFELKNRAPELMEEFERLFNLEIYGDWTSSGNEGVNGCKKSFK